MINTINRREMGLVLYQLLSACPPDFADKADKYGWSPLHILANNKDPNQIRQGMIRSLCDARANLEAVKGKAQQTPLMTAVASGHKAAVQELLWQGADPYAENREGTTIRDMAWANRELRDLVSQIGVWDGAGVSGSGRLLRLYSTRRLCPLLLTNSSQCGYLSRCRFFESKVIVCAVSFSQDKILMQSASDCHAIITLSSM